MHLPLIFSKKDKLCSNCEFMRLKDRIDKYKIACNNGFMSYHNREFLDFFKYDKDYIKPDWNTIINADSPYWRTQRPLYHETDTYLFAIIEDQLFSIRLDYNLRWDYPHPLRINRETLKKEDNWASIVDRFARRDSRRKQCSEN
jgi:hypothetical protein